MSINLLPNNQEVFRNFIKPKNTLDLSYFISKQSLDTYKKSKTEIETKPKKSSPIKKILKTLISGYFAVFAGAILFFTTNKRIAPILTTAGLALGVGEAFVASNKFFNPDKKDAKSNKQKAVKNAVISIAAIALSTAYSKKALNLLGYEVTGITKAEIEKLGILKTIKENILMLPNAAKASIQEFLSCTLHNFKSPLIVRKPKNPEVLKIQKTTQEKLGLGKVYFGEDTEYAKWFSQKLEKIHNQNIVDMKGLNIILDKEIPLEKAGGSFYSPNNEIYIKQIEDYKEKPLLEGSLNFYQHSLNIHMRVYNALHSDTIYHELGHLNHYKKAPELLKTLKKQDENRIFPADLPKKININGHELNIKEKMEELINELINKLMSYENFFDDENIVKASYSKNKYLDEFYARAFAAKNGELPNHYNATYHNKRYTQMMRALEKNNPKTVMKRIVNIVFDKYTYKYDYSEKTGVDRKTFIKQLLKEIKYDN